MFSESEYRAMCRKAGLSEAETERRLQAAKAAPPGPALEARSQQARALASQPSQPSQPSRRGHKFGASPVTLESGERFDSTGEHRRYEQLRQMERAGEVLHLTRDRSKLTFSLVVNGVKIADYIADFGYTDPATGERIIEDYKGMITPVYRIKEKLMLALYGIRIRRTTAKEQI